MKVAIVFESVFGNTEALAAPTHALTLAGESQRAGGHDAHV